MQMLQKENDRCHRARMICAHAEGIRARALAFFRNTHTHKHSFDTKRKTNETQFKHLCDMSEYREEKKITSESRIAHRIHVAASSVPLPT